MGDKGGEENHCHVPSGGHSVTHVPSGRQGGEECLCHVPSGGWGGGEGDQICYYLF